jgi:hypothetical protein
MTYDLKGPAFLYIGCHVYDGGRDQRQPIDMRTKDRSPSVYPNSVQGNLVQLLIRPFGKCALRSVPDSVLQLHASSTKLCVLNTEHARWGFPMVGCRVEETKQCEQGVSSMKYYFAHLQQLTKPKLTVSVASRPVLVVLDRTRICVPELLDQFPKIVWCLDLLEASIGVVL